MPKDERGCQQRLIVPIAAEFALSLWTGSEKSPWQRKKKESEWEGRGSEVWWEIKRKLRGHEPCWTASQSLPPYSPYSHKHIAFPLLPAPIYPPTQESEHWAGPSQNPFECELPASTETWNQAGHFSQEGLAQSRDRDTSGWQAFSHPQRRYALCLLCPSDLRAKPLPSSYSVTTEPQKYPNIQDTWAGLFIYLFILAINKD